jgi:hypothetical protein
VPGSRVRDWTNGDCLRLCKRQLYDWRRNRGLFFGETRSLLQGLVESSSPLTMRLLCVCHVRGLSEAALLHTVIYRV